MENMYYGKEIKLKKTGTDEVLFVIDDVDVESEFVLDMFYTVFERSIDYKSDKSIFTQISTIPRADLVEIARWGKAHVAELKDKPYLECVISMYSVVVAFIFYRAEMRKKS